MAPRLSRAPRKRRSDSRLAATSKRERRDQRTPSPQRARAAARWAKLPGAVLLLLSGWMLYTFFTDARFRVMRVQVDGARLLQTSAVRRVVGVAGAPSFLMDARALEARLLGEFPIIEDVSVECRLPNRVTVQIKERDSVLAWESGGQYWWVGSQGEVLGAVREPGDLVVIHDVEGFLPGPDEHIVGVPWQLAREMLVYLPAITAYDYTRDKGLVLHVTPEAWPVYLGHDGDARVKAALMRALAQELLDQGVRVAYIDLRNEQRPTYGKAS